MVTTENDAYIRSWRGPQGSWYTHATGSGSLVFTVDGTTYDVAVTKVPPNDLAQPDVDAAYRDKYRRYAGSYLAPMLAPQALDSTQSLEKP